MRGSLPRSSADGGVPLTASFRPRSVRWAYPVLRTESDDSPVEQGVVIGDQCGIRHQRGARDEQVEVGLRESAGHKGRAYLAVGTCDLVVTGGIGNRVRIAAILDRFSSRREERHAP